MSRAERKAQIVATVKANQFITTTKLAAAIGLKLTPHFRGIMAELICEQELLAEGETMANGFRIYRWIHIPKPDVTQD